MKINSLSISNFKSFGPGINQTGNSLTKAQSINMIYGDNNSGKSNTLKIISLLFSRKHKTEAIKVAGELKQHEEIGTFTEGRIKGHPFIFHKNKSEDPITFRVSLSIEKEDLRNFNDSDVKLFFDEFKYQSRKDLKVVFEGKIVDLDKKSNSDFSLTKVMIGDKTIFDNSKSPQIFPDNTEDSFPFNSSTYQSFIEQFDDLILFIDTDRFVHKKEENNVDQFTNFRGFKDWLHRLSLDPYQYDVFLKVIEFVRKSDISKDPLLKEFNPSFWEKENEEIEIILDTGVQRLPLASMGTGIQQILFILASIFQSKARIVLIEEIELNLSPKNQRKLFSALRKMIESGLISQVFFTTHSPYFNFRKDFGIYQISLEEDVSKIKRQTGASTSFFLRQRLD